MMKVINVEIKARCTDHAKIRKILSEKKANYIGKDHQVEQEPVREPRHVEDPPVAEELAQVAPDVTRGRGTRSTQLDQDHTRATPIGGHGESIVEGGGLASLRSITASCAGRSDATHPATSRSRCSRREKEE